MRDHGCMTRRSLLHDGKGLKLIQSCILGRQLPGSAVAFADTISGPSQAVTYDGKGEIPLGPQSEITVQPHCRLP